MPFQVFLSIRIRGAASKLPRFHVSMDPTLARARYATQSTLAAARSPCVPCRPAGAAAAGWCRPWSPAAPARPGPVPPSPSKSGPSPPPVGCSHFFFRQTGSCATKHQLVAPRSTTAHAASVPSQAHPRPNLTPSSPVCFRRRPSTRWQAAAPAQTNEPWC